MKRFQFVWWSQARYWTLAFCRLDPKTVALASIYRWVLWIGPLEIRRWTDDILIEEPKTGKATPWRPNKIQQSLIRRFFDTRIRRKQ